MKKLLFFFLLFSCFQISAQNRQAVSLVFGPNWFQQLNSNLLASSSYEARLGWSAGVDASFEIAALWDVKVGVRYQELNAVVKSGNLMWPSEYSTGTYVYDPSLPHSIELETRYRAWQYMLGTRYYFSQPKTWQWYGDVEAGITTFGPRPKAGKPATLLASGLGFGLQWLPLERQFGLFVQPVLRYMIGVQRDTGLPKYSVFIPAIEIGLRAQLFMDND